MSRVACVDASRWRPGGARNAAHGSSTSGCWSQAQLIEHLDAVVLDHRVAQNFARDGIQILARLHGDFEILPLANIFDAPMAKSVERRANGLTLRIEDGRFEGDVY